VQFLDLLNVTRCSCCLFSYYSVFKVFHHAWQRNCYILKIQLCKIIMKRPREHHVHIGYMTRAFTRSSSNEEYFSNGYGKWTTETCRREMKICFYKKSRHFREKSWKISRVTFFSLQKSFNFYSTSFCSFIPDKGSFPFLMG
jgi:hypothetical protein